MNNRIYYSREAEEQAQREKFFLMIFATGISMVIGAIIALLMAPQTGDETRKELLSQGREAGEQFLNNAEHFREDLTSRINHVTE